MPQRLEAISRFSPGNCKPELLESMLVGRGELVDRLERSVLESIETGAGHHWLLIGPRGVGKTHLLAVLHDRISRGSERRARVAIAYLKEEERGVASFLDWLVRILRALHRWREEPPVDESIDLGRELEGLEQLPLDAAQRAAERLLIRFVGNRRLLLITENLGQIFDEVKGMGREGQQRFRDLVQQHPFWTIVGSSQALFEDVQAREAPFYGFFRVRHLPTLDLEESATLLAKLADLEGRAELRKHFRTEVGRGRIRAIHQLTGGNPRLLVIFYQFVDRESIDDLATPFLEMVDSLTSYYQEQMQPLPALQQKIVELLCERRVPMPVKEIARSCFITHQTASKQLGRLAERRYVIATTVGRRSFYELREPLFRICFEVKENLGFPIRLFVDFLGAFYSLEEIRREHLAQPRINLLFHPEPGSCFEAFHVALSHFETGDLAAGIEQIEKGAEANEAQECASALLLWLARINEYLLRNVEASQLEDLLKRQLTIFEGSLLRDSFIEGLIGALMEVLKQCEEIDAERLTAIRELAVPALMGYDELKIACRLFAAGVDYRVTRDAKVLLALPREERQSLQEILGLGAEDQDLPLARTG